MARRGSSLVGTRCTGFFAVSLTGDLMEGGGTKVEVGGTKVEVGGAKVEVGGTLFSPGTVRGGREIS